jgi:UDP-N-acetylmuramyl pentapeptide phosphotransferase/UDP-N-acetylglucosamine-1-phosphate transferase
VVSDIAELLVSALLSGLIVSAGACVLIIATARWHGAKTMDTVDGVQKFHVSPTPRVGGVGVYLGLVAVWLASKGPVDVLGLMLIAGIPAFVFGIAEDITKRVGVKERLTATILSGLVAWFLTGISLTSVGVWGLDGLLAWAPFSVAFTVIAVAALTNAVNIVDGFNGLASGTTAIAFSALGFVGYQFGDHQLAFVCAAAIGCILGFMTVNFPLGRLFLGDGGAYLIGFLLAWVAVMLPVRNPGVSPWASLLACSYPVIEVLFSVWRKQFRQGHHPGQPDRVHLHMLIYQRVAHRVVSGLGDLGRNSMTSMILWPFSIAGAVAAAMWPRDQLVLMGALLFLCVGYYLVYLRLTQFRWCVLPATTRACR